MKKFGLRKLICFILFFLMTFQNLGCYNYKVVSSQQDEKKTLEHSRIVTIYTSTDKYEQLNVQKVEDGKIYGFSPSLEKVTIFLKDVDKIEVKELNGVATFLITALAFGIVLAVTDLKKDKNDDEGGGANSICPSCFKKTQ